MHRRAYVIASSLLFLVLACFAIALPSSRSEAQLRTPTASELAELTLVGFTGKQTSDQELAKIRGGCANSPYDDLLKKYRPGAQSSKEGQAGITQLNSDFACRLSKLLAEFPSVCINSAYRSKETQTVLWNQALAKYGSASAARKWVAPPGSSMHNKGLAADLCNSTPAVRTAAGKHGLTFRMGHEPWHVEPNGAVGGVTPEGGKTPPGPLSTVTGAVRDALGFGNQQPPPPPPQQMPPSQQLPPSAQPTQYFAPSSGGMGQTSQGGSGGGIVPVPISPGSASGAPTYTDIYAGVYEPTIGDRLLDLAYGKGGTSQSPSTSTATTTIYVSQDAAGIQGSQTSTTSNTAPGSNVAIHPSQTFVSPDLGGSNSVPPSATGITALLDMLRTMLIQILDILRPFGLRNYANTSGEYSEPIE